MRYANAFDVLFGSVCSGIEAASVAFEPLGWKAAWFAEIEPFPSAVLAHHYPAVPNLGDMTTIARRVLTGEVPAPDVLCGGTPCQAFSVAGLRESLSDARGNLTLKFVELADAIDHVRSRAGTPPCVVKWENVPGVLSTKDNAFGCFLAGLAGEDEPLQPPGKRWEDAGAVFGPKRAIAWRTLDAQFFGLAQRRRRVFVVASAREGFDPAQVLLEWDGVRRDSAPSRKAGEETAATLDARTDGGGFPGTDGACGGHVQPVAFGGNRTGGSIDIAIAFNSRQECVSSTEVFGSLGSSSPQAEAVAIRTANTSANGHGVAVEVTHTLDGANGQAVYSPRRLMPVECERLQGFPDSYTAIPWRGKPADQCPDGPRYKALGNSWAVPVVRWIGARIDAAMRFEQGAAA